MGASERMFELLDRVPTIPLTGGVLPSAVEGHIRFEEVREGSGLKAGVGGGEVGKRLQGQAPGLYKT